MCRIFTADRFEEKVPTASVRTAKRSIQAILDAIGRIWQLGAWNWSTIEETQMVSLHIIVGFTAFGLPLLS